MARTQDVKPFDSSAHRATVDAMRRRGEDVHAAGRQYREETGGLHPNVEIRNKKPRGSHNAMIPGDQPGTFILKNGISSPILSVMDGTGSTAHWVEDFFRTAERQHKLLDGVRTRYNPQLASGVVNDVYNVHKQDLPVVQISQFEGDERSADQVRLLQPASMGNNTAAEDYDLGLYYAGLVYADLWTFYGLRGYLTLTLDEIGRGFVAGADVRTYLGQSADFDLLDTREICQQLLKHWHLYILQVPTGGWGGMLERTTEWWGELVGPDRVIKVESPNLLADVRAAIVYVTEAQNPTSQGFIEFMRIEGTYFDAANLDLVWRMVQVAEKNFGAQAKLPGYSEIPKPGDVFAHYRHAWPIGHPRQSENVTPSESTIA